jgi:hypothetical protein
MVCLRSEFDMYEFDMYDCQLLLFAGSWLLMVVMVVFCVLYCEALPVCIAVMIKHTNSDTSCARGLQTPAERNHADTI